MPASKSIHLVKGNINSADKKHRIKAEEQTKTGQEMKPSELVKNNKFALNEFNELKKIYAAIKQDDAIHERTISRYCLLLADENDWITQKLKAEKIINKLEKDYLADKINTEEYYTNNEKNMKIYFQCEKEIKSTRKMILDIEKASCLTLSDRLRAIPKKAEEKKESEMGKFLRSKKG